MDSEFFMSLFAFFGLVVSLAVVVVVGMYFIVGGMRYAARLLRGIRDGRKGKCY